MIHVVDIDESAELSFRSFISDDDDLDGHSEKPTSPKNCAEKQVCVHVNTYIHAVDVPSYTMWRSFALLCWVADTVRDESTCSEPRVVLPSRFLGLIS